MNCQSILVVPTDEELDQLDCNFSFDSNANIVTCDTTLGVEKSYSVDSVLTFGNFGALYDMRIVTPLIQDAVSGYNSFLFCAATKESMMPYALYGDHSSRGILKDVLLQLLEQSETFHSVSLSVIELYSESIRDILSPNNEVSFQKNQLCGNEVLELKTQYDVESILHQVGMHQFAGDGLSYTLFIIELTRLMVIFPHSGCNQS
jgi:hypothetical protein